MEEKNSNRELDTDFGIWILWSPGLLELFVVFEDMSQTYFKM